MPDVGGGLAGFGQQLADMLGGLIGSSDDALGDPPGIDEQPEIDEPAVGDESDDETDDGLSDDETDDEPSDDRAETGEVDDQTCDVGEPPPPVEPAPPPAEAAPTPVPEPPLAPPVPPEQPEPATATGTPCEIAADELPQVGQ
jgi:hypothetical protein